MEDKKKLKPANKNPYYILATLYGESSDPEIVDKNASAWNAWACRYKTDAERAELSAEIMPRYKELEYLPETSIVPIEAWSNIKGEVTKKFNEAMKKRSGLKVSLISLPDPREPIDFTGLQFTKPVHFWGYIFPSLTGFEGSVFLERANFMYARFLDGASFHDIHFKGFATFRRAYFSRSTFTFMRTSLYKPANFEGTVTFRSAQCEQSFSFRRARIVGFASFAAAVFNGLCDFSRTIIGGNIEFNDAILKGSARFVGTQFKKNVSFRGAEAYASIVLERAMFAQYPDFRDADVYRKIIVNPKDRNWPQGPIKMLEGETEGKTEEIALSCAVLRHNLAEQGLPDEAHFFFRHEMKVRSLTAKGYERWLYRIYDWGFSYGHSLIKPMVWLGLLMGLCGGIFKFVGSLDYWQALSLSLANTFSIFGLHRMFFGSGFIRGLSGGLQLLIGVQIIVSFILLFFLGLALRNRFRLK